MAQADFNYTCDGLFYRLLPNNTAAEWIWRGIAAVFEGGVIDASAWGSIKAQLKEAGYTVREGLQSAAISDDELLAALAA